VILEVECRDVLQRQLDAEAGRPDPEADTFEVKAADEGPEQDHS
jgi:hypothetical protein